MIVCSPCSTGSEKRVDGEASPKSPVKAAETDDAMPSLDGESPANDPPPHHGDESQGEQPQPMYTVCFDGNELWGPSTEPRERVYIDLWESYLEPA